MSKSKTLLAGARCLIVDDEFLIALDLQDILQTAGATTVACFSDADEALAALQAGETFDLAVLDVNLGGADRTSFSVAAALADRKTPFIFLTGMHHDATSTSNYRDAPVLEKPYRQEVLLATIRSLLTRA